LQQRNSRNPAPPKLPWAPPIVADLGPPSKTDIARMTRDFLAEHKISPRE
jgi:hypothetical protein